MIFGGGVAFGEVGAEHGSGLGLDGDEFEGIHHHGDVGGGVFVALADEFVGWVDDDEAIATVFGFGDDLGDDDKAQLAAATAAQKAFVARGGAGAATIGPAS